MNIRSSIQRGDDSPECAAEGGPFFAPPSPTVEKDLQGNLIIGNSVKPAQALRQMSDYLRQWSTTRPERVFLAQRREGEWETLSYGKARARTDCLSQSLIELGLVPSRPLMCIAENSVPFALLKLAAMQVGVPVQPVSTAYCSASADFRRLRTIVGVGNPAAIYVPSLEQAWTALDACAPTDAVLICDDLSREPKAVLEAISARQSREVVDLVQLEQGVPSREMELRYDAVGPDSIAKVLMTSGSTGVPKGVIITQGTMTANGAAVVALWPFLSARPPVLVDWLPWSHTFGTNFNLNQILRHGGTLYIDEGRPMPGRWEASVRNLASISPTLLYNVPRGFDMLLSEIDRDAGFAEHLFSDLDAIFYAGAALSPGSWRRLDEIAQAVRGHRIPILSSLGSTETGPVATLTHWLAEAPNSIGLPVPGTEVRLVPDGEKLEMRVRGPSVSPGYYRAPEATTAAFDEFGFFRLGDAVTFQPDRLEAGLTFDGRISENFKLQSGSWVNVGALRTDLLDRIGPVARDAVIAGHDRDEIRVLIIPGPATSVLTQEEVRSAICEGLDTHNACNRASSRKIAAAMIFPGELSVDSGEITDKGYINQRRVLENHRELIERLYAQPADPDLIIPGQTR